MLELNESNFKKEVLESKMPVLVDYFADWCGPCKQMAPVFAKVSKEFPKIKFAKLDVQSNKSLAGKHDVTGIPCLILFVNGKEKDRITGYLPEDQLKEKIKSIV